MIGTMICTNYFLCRMDCLMGPAWLITLKERLYFRASIQISSFLCDACIKLTENLLSHITEDSWGLQAGKWYSL